MVFLAAQLKRIQNIVQALNSQKTPHISPSRASYGASLWATHSKWSQHIESVLYYAYVSIYTHQEGGFHRGVGTDMFFWGVQMMKGPSIDDDTFGLIVGESRTEGHLHAWRVLAQQ